MVIEMGIESFEDILTKKGYEKMDEITDPEDFPEDISGEFPLNRVIPYMCPSTFATIHIGEVNKKSDNSDCYFFIGLPRPDENSLYGKFDADGKPLDDGAQKLYAELLS